MDPTFRFLHAGDLHLERPLGGLAEIPDQLREVVADAAYRTAERVFDAALKHRVDFVVLAGDVLNPRAAGPRAIEFLETQFQKLADVGIRVYWAGSPLDGFELWTDLWPLPDTVHRFDVERVERIVHHRAGEPLVQILGTSGNHQKRIAAADFHAADGLFAVAVAHGIADPETLARHAIAYWALGGEHDRRTLIGGTVTAHYCGTPQGRTPEESGPHGCTLVQVDETGRVRTTFLPTDAVRYSHERVVVGPSTPIGSLTELLNERVGELLIDPFGPELLVSWTIEGSEAMARSLHSGNHPGDLLSRLRTEHGSKKPAAWSLSLDVDQPELPEDLYEEETLLGEFLRTAQQQLENLEEPLSLEAYLAERHLAGALAPLAALNDPELRRQVLTEAAALGVDLLSPTEERL